MSERAYSLLEEVYYDILPYIEEDLSKEHVEFPTFRIIRSIRVGERIVSGYADDRKKTITVSAEEVDRLFEKEYSEPIVRYAMTSAFFHELKHYKDLMKMTPEEREKFHKAYPEDPEYRAEFEGRAMTYGFEWARKIEEIMFRKRLEELTGILEELRRTRSPSSSESPEERLAIVEKWKVV